MNTRQGALITTEQINRDRRGRELGRTVNQKVQEPLRETKWVAPNKVFVGEKADEPMMDERRTLEAKARFIERQSAARADELAAAGSYIISRNLMEYKGRINAAAKRLGYPH